MWHHNYWRTMARSGYVSRDYVVPLRQDEHIDGMPSDIIKLGLNNEVQVIR